MNRRDTELNLRRIYAKVPRIKCKGLCTDCCGPIGMTPIEAHRLNRAAKHEVHAEGLTCSALKDGKCSAYGDRPLICRLWGVTEKMRCEFGCEIIDNNGEPLTDEETILLVRAAERIDPGPPVWTLPADEINFIRKLVEQIESRG